MDLERGELLVMESKEERWRELCARAAVEKDPQTLMELVKEIGRLLDQKRAGRKSQTEGFGINDDDLTRT